MPAGSQTAEKAVAGGRVVGFDGLGRPVGGVSYTANLTPDRNTGIGIWTEEMFVRPPDSIVGTLTQK